jgi:ankyrin repeat protein
LLGQAAPVKDSLINILISSDKCEFANALHLAAANNKATTVKILLDFGFSRSSKTGVWKMVNDPDETSPGDFTALDLASKFGASEAAQVLEAP